MKKILLSILIFSFLVIGCVQQTPIIQSEKPDTTIDIEDNETDEIVVKEPKDDYNITEANNLFALELYAVLKEQEGNVFFSPWSISTALTMTYEGARGKTAEEIQSVFHFPKNDEIRRIDFSVVYNLLNQENAEYKLNTANALWVQNDYKLLDEYTSTIDRYYDGKVTNVDFKRTTEEARQTINKWVEDKTNNKIKDLFPEGTLTPSTRLALTNAIYFKGVWLKQFDENQTADEDFFVSKSETVKVSMMRQTGKDAKFNYAKTDGLQILEMPYEGENLSMIILLPENEIQSLEKLITLVKLNEWKSQLREQTVYTFIPKFTFTTKYFLNENLDEMGMPSAFNPGTADFSGITGTKDLSIQVVVHQAFVDVNEEGTEAAAATGVSFAVTSAPIVEIFRADHPFIFIIQDKRNDNILFMGRVNNPLS